MSLSPKFNGLDHLRSFAILYVILFHYNLPFFGHPDWLGKLISFGWTGVDLFFVLSGFLISSQLFKEIKTTGNFSYKTFFVKRFFRIIPSYWFVLILYFLFPIIHEKEALPSFWRFFTFTQNLDLWAKSYGTFSHAWSLCVEEHFYLALPLVLFVALRFKLYAKCIWLILLLFVFGFFIRAFSWTHFFYPKMFEPGDWEYWYSYIYYISYTRLDGLLVGVSIAAMYVYKENWFNTLSKYSYLWLILGIASLYAAFLLDEDTFSFVNSVYAFPVVAFGYGLILLAALSPNTFLYKYDLKVTQFIAKISFTLYLSHKAAFHCIQLVLESWQMNLKSNEVMLISILFSMAIAYLIHLGIEQPFMRWRSKILAIN